MFLWNVAGFFCRPLCKRANSYAVVMFIVCLSLSWAILTDRRTISSLPETLNSPRQWHARMTVKKLGGLWNMSLAWSCLQAADFYSMQQKTQSMKRACNWLIGKLTGSHTSVPMSPGSRPRCSVRFVMEGGNFSPKLYYQLHTNSVQQVGHRRRLFKSCIQNFLQCLDWTICSKLFDAIWNWFSAMFTNCYI
jgi:hypothetical protein